MRSSVFMMMGALALSGCSSSSQAGREQPAGGDQRQMMGQGGMHTICPTMVEGTTVRAEDVEGGAALVFITTGDVTELRSRVARMAERHNRHPSNGDGMGRRQGGGMMGGHGMMMIPADAHAEDVEDGARIVFTPNDPGQLSALREQVRQRAAWMASGQCPMEES